MSPQPPEVSLGHDFKLMGLSFKAVSQVFRHCYNLPHERQSQPGPRVNAWIEEILGPGFLDQKQLWKTKAWISDFLDSDLDYRNKAWDLWLGWAAEF